MSNKPKVIHINIPLINPNEPEARIVALNFKDGQRVSRGDVIAVIETTKATEEIVAEEEGYFFGGNKIEGQTVRAGERLGVITDSPTPHPSEVNQPASQDENSTPSEGNVDLPAGIRITRPALKLAREHRVDLRTFQPEVLITEKMVKDMIMHKPGSQQDQLRTDLPSIIIYGGGGHGKTLIDLLRSMRDYEIVGIIDDGISPGEEILGVAVLGGRESINQLYQSGVRNAANAVGGIGDIQSRINIFKILHDAGFFCPPLIHRTAILEPSAKLSAGVQILALSYIGSNAQIGYGVIINTSAVVSHDCRIGDYSVVSPGALIAGGVEIGRAVLIGMAVTINLGVKIGDGARIGNGATVKADVPVAGIVRAGSIWPG